MLTLKKFIRSLSKITLLIKERGEFSNDEDFRER